MPILRKFASPPKISSKKIGRAAAAATQLWGWGGNELRTAGASACSSPIQIGSATTWTQVSGGGYHAVGLVGGSVKAWGSTSEGAIDGNVAAVGNFQYSSAFTFPNASFVNAGRFNTRIIRPTGELFTFGQNYKGGLGLGDTTDRSSPVQVGALTNWSKVNHVNSFGALAIKTDGTLWSWGQNNAGQLGLGNTTDYSSPKAIGSDTDWATLANYGRGGRLAAAIKTNGTLWTWGQGGYPNEGSLGHNNTTNYSSPKQIPGTNWAKIATFYRGGFTAVKTDGTLWVWGKNGSGQLGLSDLVARSSPTQVGSLTNWLRPIGGYYHQACIKTDGTLWAWGSNGYGQLGQNNTTNSSSPVQVGALTSWITGSVTKNTVLAIKSP